MKAYLTLILLILTLGSNTRLSAAPISDPFELVNRVSFAVHQTADRFILRPIAMAYRTVTPDFIETRLRNFFDNLGAPISGVNALLQGKGRKSWIITQRFLINSSIGIIGLFDVADEMGLAPTYEDSAQTLAQMGLPSGPYLFIPFLGPSSPRHLVGRVFDQVLLPTSHLDEPRDRNLALSLGLLQTRADLLDPLDELEASSADLYVSMRSFYWQNREFKINDGNTSIDELPDVLELGD